MARLAPRQRLEFSCFTDAEVEKMEELFNEAVQHLMNKENCHKVAKSFNSSEARAGKAVVDWTDVKNWFQSRHQTNTSEVACSTDASKEENPFSGSCSPREENENCDLPTDTEGKVLKMEELEFEARSVDGAWYDVDMFLTHRFRITREAEVLVRYVGFGPEYDEWVKVKEGVRLRSIPFDDSECHKVKVGDHILCFQEIDDQANHYDAHVIGILRRMHDIRGCRCLFHIRFNHDNSEEMVRLRRLCRRPSE